MRNLKLMPDYFSFPLWDTDAPDNVDPAALPLSDATRARLAAWAAEFDAILNMDDPAASDFPSPEAERAFDQEGFQLWRQVSQELDGQYAVSYYSIARHTLLPPTQFSQPGATPSP